MADDRPAWARRMYNERQARGWSQADAVRAMRAHYSREHPARELPDSASLLRQYKRWEAGEVEPDRGRAVPLYKPIIAATFGTVTHAMFPVAPKRDADADVLAVTGMDTLELVSRLQRSDLDQAGGGVGMRGSWLRVGLPGPADHAESAPRDPDAGGLDYLADRVRRI